MEEDIKLLLKKENIKEVEDIMELSGERFILHYKYIYNELPSKERIEDVKVLSGFIKLSLMNDINFCWYKNYIFPSGNIGSLANLLLSNEFLSIFLNDLGFIDPVTKEKF